MGERRRGGRCDGDWGGDWDGRGVMSFVEVGEGEEGGEDGDLETFAVVDVEAGAGGTSSFAEREKGPGKWRTYRLML